MRSLPDMGDPYQHALEVSIVRTDTCSNYVLWTAGSLDWSLPSWTPLLTNQFDLLGRFTNILPFEATAPQQFYRLQSP